MALIWRYNLRKSLIDTSLNIGFIGAYSPTSSHTWRILVKATCHSNIETSLSHRTSACRRDMDVGGSDSHLQSVTFVENTTKTVLEKPFNTLDKEAPRTPTPQGIHNLSGVTIEPANSVAGRLSSPRSTPAAKTVGSIFWTA